MLLQIFEAGLQIFYLVIRYRIGAHCLLHWLLLGLAGFGIRLFCCVTPLELLDPAC